MDGLQSDKLVEMIWLIFRTEICTFTLALLKSVISSLAATANCTLDPDYCSFEENLCIPLNHVVFGVA